MKINKSLLSAVALCLLAVPYVVQAADGNWKRGRIYYRMVCTACHVDQAGGSIAPSTMTIAEWTAYIDADKHAKGKDKVSYYTSQEYRGKIKDSNKAAASLLKVPDDELLSDVKAFVLHGAKDSDTPARCN